MSFAATLLQHTQAVTQLLQVPVNRQGEVLTRANNRFDTFPGRLLLGVANTDEELNQSLGLQESFETVFNRWLRISRSPGGTHDNANPAELDAWQYNPATDQIRCTVNSTSIVGFISPEKYEHYVLEAQLSSTNSDDDTIGLCIAHAQAGDGKTYGLYAMRNLNGPAPLMVSKDSHIHNSGGYRKALVFNGLTWADGTVASGAVTGDAHGGWNTIPSGIRLRVQRAGDIITVKTSQPNSTEYFEPATYTFDLSEDPELEVFRGPQRIGYICFSQRLATWSIIQRPGSHIPVLDTRSMTLWVYQDDAWTSSSTTWAALVNARLVVPGALHYNPATLKYYMAHNQAFLPV